MPHSKSVLCSGVCFLFAAVTIAQSLPKHPTMQQVVGFQIYQQQIWNLKQIPVNSVLYTYQSRSLNFPVEKKFSISHAPAFTFQFASRNYLQTANDLNINFSLSTSNLHSYLLQKGKQSYQWQKQSWWKDPNNGRFSELLRDLILKNKTYPHL